MLLLTTSKLLVGACLLLQRISASYPHGPANNERIPPRQQQQTSFRQLIATYNQQTLSTLQGTCTSQNVVVRREWDDMSPEARQDYVQACYCLRQRPSQVDTPDAPGARNRWDDFVELHASNNEPIHVSPILLAWHRQFNAEFERALRDECGYGHGLPYLDFTRYQDIPPEQWSVFDNSPTSLSGDGEPTPDGCRCVTSGRLAEWVVDMGSAGADGQCRRNPQNNGLGLNPHCLERQFNVGQLPYLREELVLGNILDNDNATTFMPAIERAPNFMHGSMHAFVGGTQRNTAFSPGEPFFFLMHGWLDLVWAVWQSLDPSTRFDDLAPPDAYIPLRQEVNQGPPPQIFLQSPLPGFEQVRVVDTMSTTSGSYCYVYQ